MTMQFLPWVRRGLAAELEHVDDGGPLPAQATLPVTITVGGSNASQDVKTYGPGEVTGLDTQTITRTAPGARAIGVAPDEFVAVEFDTPDLPWMFTPARASGGQRLRPWLVVVVIRKTTGVRIGVERGAPLPVLTIEDPSVPEEELPDLSQSWAWAHTQVITPDASTDARAALSGPAHTRLARIVCPRRLETGTDYIAALVPAFDLGVAAGLGLPADGDTAGPAWDIAAMPASIRLPVYYHWEFKTGPAGDFESLARKLRPIEIPDTVGRAPMYIGAAHPALPDPPDGTGIVNMEGALRAPEPGPGENLAPALGPWVDALTAIVDATSAQVTGGTASDAEPVGPPIYGQWHVNRHSVPARGRRPRWLRDINADPRFRAAAGLGAEVVRAYQEEYMDAAWQQAGNVLAANAMLALARAMAAVTDRIHDRHVATIDPLQVLPFIGPARERILIDDFPLDRLLRETVTLPGTEGRMFRRMASPRSPHLRAAAIRAGQPLSPGGGVATDSLGRLTDGGLVTDLQRMPDGLRTSRAPEVVDRLDATLRGPLAPLVQTLEARGQALEGVAPQPLKPRDDLTAVGFLDAEVLAGLRASTTETVTFWERAEALRELAASGAFEGNQVLGVLATGDALSVLGTTGQGQLTATANGRTTVIDVPGIATPGRAPGSTGRRVPLGGTGGLTFGERDRGRVPADRLRDALHQPESRLRFDRRGTGIGADRLGIDRRLTIGSIDAVRDAVTSGTIDLAPVFDALGPGAGRDDAVFLPLPGGMAGALDTFVGDLQAISRHSETTFDAFAPAVRPPALDIATVQSQVIARTRPRPLIEARVKLRLEANGGSFANALAAGVLGATELFQEAPVAPVLIGPVLDRPLYHDLARFDQARFLPGAEDIPENAISLLETNPRFVEAFMVGANHEFNRELLWRRYPTDRRATALRKFWDRIDGSDDIDQIHRWPSGNRLGSMGRGDVDGSVVLIVRGELLRRYPQTIVYAVAATADRRIDPAAAPIGPVFSGRLAPDFTFVGFDFDIDAAKAGNGMMFVLQEQPTEPRFGLDAAGPGAAGTAPAIWSDLNWNHAGVAPGGFLDISVFGPTVRRPLTDAPGAPEATFNTHSADFAAITFQRPFRAAVHVSEIEG